MTKGGGFVMKATRGSWVLIWKKSLQSFEVHHLVNSIHYLIEMLMYTFQVDEFHSNQLRHIQWNLGVKIFRIDVDH